MKIGLNNILADEQFGMPQIIEGIQQAAEAHDMVIGISRVSKFAKSFIEAGYPTKPYHVKNKTILEGVAAGLITIKPEYSQVEDKDYQTYHQQLSGAFNKDLDLKSIPCVLNENRIHELKALSGDAICIQFSAEKNEYAISWKKQDKTMAVTAKKNNLTNDYTIYDDSGEPLQVLGKEIVDSEGQKLVKPVTADLDPFGFFPAYSDLDLNGKDKTPFSTQGSLHRIQSIIRASVSPFYFGPKEDPDRGNLNARTREFLDVLKKHVQKVKKNRRGKNLELVHHNAELHNPFASELDDHLPMLMIFPRQINIASMLKTAENPFAKQVKIMLIESKEELQKLCEILHINKYYVPPHSKYPELRVPQQDELILRKFQQ